MVRFRAYLSCLGVLALSHLFAGCTTPAQRDGSPTWREEVKEAKEGVLRMEEASVRERIQELRSRWQTEPIPVGLSKQLFYDDAIIATKRRIKRNLGSVEKLNDREPVIVADQAWETQNRRVGVGAGWLSVIRNDEGVFQCWYGSGYVRPQGTLHVGYAISDDGVTWRKPYSRHVYHPAYGFGVLYDPDDPRPKHRYKMVHGGMEPEPIKVNENLMFAHSGDGVNWRPYPSYDYVLGCDSDTGSSLYWDDELNTYRVTARHPQSDRYRGIKQYSKPTFGVSPRQLSKLVSPDWEETMGVEVLHETHVPKTQSYSFNVERQGDVYVGKMALYEDDIWYCLAVSRDGVSWDWSWIDRKFSLIPRGDTGSFDEGAVWPASSPMIADGDRYLVYYIGSRGGHGGGGEVSEEIPHWYAIGVAEMRMDGLFYVEPDGVDGVVETKSFLCEGTSLRMNADASLGVLSVEVVDGAGAVIDGYDRSSFEPWTSDQINKRAVWVGGRDLSSLKGSVIRLRFHLVGPVKLFSFQVVNEMIEPSLNTVMEGDTP